MAVEGIIDGLKEIMERYDLGVHNGFVKEAIDALTEVDKSLDEAYAAGKYDQLQECFSDIIEEMTKGGLS